MARIFVVEDDASLREELMRLLELQGHTAPPSTASWTMFWRLRPTA